MVAKKKEGIPAEETASPYPPMQLAQTMHRLTVKPELEQLQIKTFDEIVQDLENPSLYKLLKEKLYDGKEPLLASAKLTDDDLKEMEDKNAAKLKELEAAVEEAIESAGDMEVMDARVEVARFASKSLSQSEALAAYEKVLALPKVSSGKKIDSLMACARVASFYSDTSAADAFMDRAHKLAEVGGGADWDRRNRLKVYRALQCMLQRDMETASTLLLDCIATFSCVEMCTYQEFIVYTILTNLLHIPRPDLKKKIIDGPEVLSVAPEIPQVVRCLLPAFFLLLQLQYLVQTQHFFFIANGTFSCTAQIGSLLLQLRLQGLLARHGRSGRCPVAGSFPASTRCLLDARTAHFGLQAVPRQLPECHALGHGQCFWCVDRLY